MPFTIGGEWIPEPSPKSKHPPKIIKEKRRASYVTLILNLPMDEAQLKNLCSTLKQRLGCGGSVKEGKIELQGDQVENIKAYFKAEKLKSFPFS
jgi:translation initiation factor 1